MAAIRSCLRAGYQSVWNLICIELYYPVVVQVLHVLAHHYGDVGIVDRILLSIV
jgi:hypothetical protein